MMWTCYQNTSGMSVSPTGPEVEPHVTSQPSPLSELIESFQVAAATFSKTTSTPRLSVAKTAFRPLGMRRVVDVERRQDKGPVNGTVLGTTRRPFLSPVQRGQPVCHRSFSQNGALVQRHGPAPNTPRPYRSSHVSESVVASDALSDRMSEAILEAQHRMPIPTTASTSYLGTVQRYARYQDLVEAAAMAEEHRESEQDKTSSDGK
jgi:hypothetical protein